MASFLVRIRPLKVHVLLAVLSTVRFCTGANVTMGWDPSPSTTVASYRVYYGVASQTYSTYAQVAAPATNVLITNLVAGTTYYFGAKAVDVSGAESGFSNEAIYTPPITTGTTAASFNVATLEDTPASVTLRGASGSGNPLTYAVKTLPTMGTLSGTA